MRTDVFGVGHIKIYVMSVGVTRRDVRGVSLNTCQTADGEKIINLLGTSLSVPEIAFSQQKQIIIIIIIIYSLSIPTNSH